MKRVNSNFFSVSCLFVCLFCFVYTDSVMQLLFLLPHMRTMGNLAE